ncbi:hypothetical protein [Actinoplanes couchii]|uniref:Uncharacterized protein n=1 Tax=Actinoplanes couchii TaxID=403638 RepID=A0ABQ3XU96_9ACTN|nr:hypothetical protein [Actinoplanes couchii]MDR6321979.1 wyosine [tRNA(Phe)-imidazoG37] synthetase (radical SAM superfamily) [Actinoplanes couchii]GID61995.1 hypothetical protein Aco03nite_103990 [Actinoplanes couchii]
MTNDQHIPRPTIDQEAIRTHLHAVRQRPTPVTVWTVIGDVPVLLAEVDRIARLLTRARWDFADLLAAARATLSADRDGEPDPLTYLRDAVAEHQEWIPPELGELAE